VEDEIGLRKMPCSKGLMRIDGLLDDISNSLQNPSSRQKKILFVLYLTFNKKSELMFMRHARAYISSCSQVILVYLYPFRRNSLFCRQKSP